MKVGGDSLMTLSLMTLSLEGAGGRTPSPFVWVMRHFLRVSAQCKQGTPSLTFVFSEEGIPILCNKSSDNVCE